MPSRAKELEKYHANRVAVYEHEGGVRSVTNPSINAHEDHSGFKNNTVLAEENMTGATSILWTTGGQTGLKRITNFRTR